MPLMSKLMDYIFLKFSDFLFPIKSFVVGGLPNEAFANDKGLSQCDAKSRGEAGNRDGQERGFKHSDHLFSKSLSTF